jgi:hypothetical protein
MAAKNFRMRQLDAGGVARRRSESSTKSWPLSIWRAVLERAEPQFRSLQIDQDADRPAVARLRRANGLDQLAHLVVRGVAHIDAEDVGAGLEQAADHGAVGRRRAERRQDLVRRCVSLAWFPGAAGGGRPVQRRAGRRIGGPGGGPAGRVARNTPGSGCGGCSLDSVSCTVQARCSPVSTSKKPVRSSRAPGNRRCRGW